MKPKLYFNKQISRSHLLFNIYMLTIQKSIVIFTDNNKYYKKKNNRLESIVCSRNVTNLKNTEIPKTHQADKIFKTIYT